MDDSQNKNTGAIASNRCEGEAYSYNWEPHGYADESVLLMFAAVRTITGMDYVTILRALIHGQKPDTPF